MPEILSYKHGINERLLPSDPEFPLTQCVRMQNLRYVDSFIESIPGTIKLFQTSLGTDPITGILPYYNDETKGFALLAAAGDTIYKRNESTLQFSSLKSGLTKNSIFTNADRLNVKYIASADGLFKFLGGNTIETVGGGLTKPRAFRVVIYMKEIDRMFGLGDYEIPGLISWCDLSQPEIWDAANIDRMKFQDGEIVEGGGILYGKLIIFNTYSIWIYYVSGNEENWKLEEAPTNVGCRAPNTIRKVGSEYWFLGDTPRGDIGVYGFDGSKSRLLTDDITPLLKLMNPNHIREAAAELHNGLYRLSFCSQFGAKNDTTIELDTRNLKEDGTPAIYGPHDIAFHSSAVLDTKINRGELLLGDPEDGFIYREGGTTLKSVNQTDGQLLRNHFLSPIYSEEKASVMKRYKNIRSFFIPRGFINCRFNVYLSRSTYGDPYNHYQQSAFNHVSGDFDVLERRIYGIPESAEQIIPTGLNSRGTSIQFELINDNLAQRIAFQGFGWDSEDLYKTRKVQTYAI